MFAIRLQAYRALGRVWDAMIARAVTLKPLFAAPQDNNSALAGVGA